MEKTLFNWLFNLLKVFAGFGSWLTTPLDYINLPPLAIFGVVGLTTLIGIHVAKLFVDW